MEREGAWSEDGQAWFAREHYPKRSQAMSYFSKFTDIPYVEVSCYSRHARHAPDDPAAAMYDGAYWVECAKDEPGAFPVWRCE
jgi:hypothetical protein